MYMYFHFLFVVRLLDLFYDAKTKWLPMKIYQQVQKTCILLCKKKYVVSEEEMSKNYLFRNGSFKLF